MNILLLQSLSSRYVSAMKSFNDVPLEAQQVNDLCAPIETDGNRSCRSASLSRRIFLAAPSTFVISIRCDKAHPKHAERCHVVQRDEALDRARCKPSYVDDLFRDLEYLGLTWDEVPLYQSQRDEAYAQTCTQSIRHASNGQRALSCQVQGEGCAATRDGRAICGPPAKSILNSWSVHCLGDWEFIGVAE